MSGILINPYAIAPSRPVPGTEAAAFLARVTGASDALTDDYVRLINGLVAAGLYTLFDVLRTYATQDSATGLLNLASSSFNGTIHGSPTFTADRGFTGVDSSSTVYIDSGFNPNSGSPQFARNSAHISVWNLTNTDSGSSGMGAIDSGSDYLLTRYIDGKGYFRVNATNSASDGVTNADARGHHIANRSSSSAMQGYRNGSNILTNASSTSTVVPNRNLYELAINNGGTALGVGHQIAAVSAGASLNSTQAADFYNLLRTFMTARGVP